MTLLRMRTTWTGFTGAPGVTTFHFNFEPFDESAFVTTCAEAVRTFWDTIDLFIPSGVRVAIDAQAEVINPEDGEVQKVIGFTPPAALNGGGTGGFPAPAGAVIHWLTSDVRRGRRVRGRTFIVPLANGSFEGNGTLNPTAHGAIINAANALRADETIQLSLWSRPNKEDFITTLPGSQYRVSGSSVPDKVAILTSRRD